MRRQPPWEHGRRNNQGVLVTMRQASKTPTGENVAVAQRKDMTSNGLLELQDYFVQGHTCELFFDPGTRYFDDMKQVRIGYDQDWYFCESIDSIFKARTGTIEHAFINGIGYLNLASDKPLSMGWLSGSKLDLDAFFHDGHRLQLCARNWKTLSRRNVVWWVNVGYDDRHGVYVEHENTETVSAAESQKAFDIGMKLIANLEARKPKDATA